jgi:hypothetical protein
MRERRKVGQIESDQPQNCKRPLIDPSIPERMFEILFNEQLLEKP